MSTGRSNSLNQTILNMNIQMTRLAIAIALVGIMAITHRAAAAWAYIA